MSLKAISGIFGYFYHYASGKYSARKVSDLSIFFIIGAETLPAVIFVILNFIFSSFTFTNLDPTSNLFLLPLAGLLFALAIAFFFFYFQKSKGTKLFIPRSTATTFMTNAQKIKFRSDAFILGFTAGLPELIFTLPLYFIVLTKISESFILPSICAPILLFFILLTISPLFYLYAYFRQGNNLANFARLRAKNKTFFRFFVSSLYLSLAILLIIFEVSL